MKHLRLYEDISQKLIEGYKDKIFVNVPSTIYFKSSIKFQVIIVDSITRGGQILSTKFYDTYRIESNYIMQFDQNNIITYGTWDQVYSKNDFDRIQFMTAQEYYKNAPNVFMAILNDAIQQTKGNKTQYHLDRMNRIIDVFTIPETEHMIQAYKYNL